MRTPPRKRSFRRGLWVSIAALLLAPLLVPAMPGAAGGKAPIAAHLAVDPRTSPLQATR